MVRVRFLLFMFILLLPVGVGAVEPCKDPAIGVYTVDRLREGLRPTHRCTEVQARYLRKLFSDAHRDHAKSQRSYVNWLKQWQTDWQVPEERGDSGPSRRRYRVRTRN